MQPSRQSLLRDAMDSYRRRDFDRARRAAKAVQDQVKGDRDAEHLLALCALEEGDTAGAARHMKRALRRRPAPPELLNTLGMVERASGHAGKAVDAFVEALRAAPAMRAAAVNLARTILETSPETARPRLLRTAKRGMSRLPEHLASVLLEARDEAAAADLLRLAVSLTPEAPGPRLMLAGLSYLNVPPAEALGHLEAAHEAAPDDPAVGAALAGRLLQANRLDDSDALARQVLDRDETSVDARLVRAQVALRRRDWEAAGTVLDALDTVSLTVTQTVTVQHLRARLADGLDRIAEAVDWQRTAKATLATTPEGRRADPEVLHGRIAAYDRVLAAAAPRPATGAAPGEARPVVFLCGFPRSGTTLMERILDAHGAFAVAPELPLVTTLSDQAGPLLGRSLTLPRDLESLTEEDSAVLAEAYFREADAVVKPEAGRILVDKMPLNMVELPLIARLFPQARVLMALRDPRDVVSSCVMNLFVANHATAAMTTPDETARLYDAVMGGYARQRRAVDVPLHEYRYEDLVSAPRQTLAGILEFLGVPWTDRVLDHHRHGAGALVTTPSADSVAAPLSTRAVGRWARYRPVMDEAFATLEPWVREFHYEQGAHAA